MKVSVPTTVMAGVLIATVLTCAAMGREMPAPAPAPPVQVPEGISRAQGSWANLGPPAVGAGGVLALLLALVALGYLVAGLVQRRHDWTPLVLGLFALGTGLLGGMINMLGSCRWIASSGHGTIAAIVDALYITLLPVMLGLGAVLLGGLFTAILCWRNERFRKEQRASAAEEPRP